MRVLSSGGKNILCACIAQYWSSCTYSFVVFQELVNDEYKYTRAVLVIVPGTSRVVEYTCTTTRVRLQESTGILVRVEFWEKYPLYLYSAVLVIL